ncbi:carboxypeptidase-like regulatory domain-containing protein [Alicyclobacillus shizuokensis]|uniref:carboxypeptidase-like regulatory domain-containing protein n=1 Tax=Alicyclobacillus shizuokensis TaxID=392014 RepID=UPI000A6FCA01|nr:carboxypeptidase-like regulatory domain-containing protein [Alicyclobacillus shizuokensis]
MKPQRHLFPSVARRITSACVIAAVLTPHITAQATTPSEPGQHSVPVQQPGTSSRDRLDPYAPWPTARLRVHVIDGRTLQPLPGAEVVLVETEQRLRTDANGYTPWFDAPVIRNPRFRPLVAELHGQLTVIAYKNGYRDSIHMGIRTHEGMDSEATVWMYKIGPEDRRIEPVLYQVPYHHLWLIELVDRFRRNSQLGEGWQDPNR